MENHNLEYNDLLKAGVHYGHLTRKWNPKMAPYIFMERNGIHIIDLNKTLVSLNEACGVARNLARSGRRVLFVATKKQAREVVAAEAARLKMPFVTERWLGGMLTNFATIRRSLKKMQLLDKKIKDPTFENLTKKERLMMGRERDKLYRILGGISEMHKLPAALFIIDLKKEHIAIEEARSLGIPVIGVVDTNVDPDGADFAIPANDDAFKSISIITQAIGAAIETGLLERKSEKEDTRTEDLAAAEEAGDEETLATIGADDDEDIELPVIGAVAEADASEAETIVAQANDATDESEEK